MAEAKIATKLIPVTTHREERQVTLILTPEEAVFLACIMNKVGGDPDTTIRKYQEGITVALRGVNVYGCKPGRVTSIATGVSCLPGSLYDTEFLNAVDRVKRATNDPA